MNYKKIYKFAILFVKLANLSKQQAADILGVSPTSSESEINKAYRHKAKSAHPDAGGSPAEMIKINVARDVLLNTPNDTAQNYNTNNGSEQAYNGYVDDYSPEPSYEEIAEMRKSKGRDVFDREYPGWIQELKSEIGIDEYNRIFEDYDPNYDPNDYSYNDPYRESDLEHLRNQLYDDIYGLDFDSLEEKIYLTNSEDKYDILNIVMAPQNAEYIISILNDLGIGIRKLNLDRYKKVFTDREIEEIIRDAVNEKMKVIISNNKKFFSKNISLFDIFKNNLYYCYDPDIHLSIDQLNLLKPKEAKKYFQNELNDDKYSKNHKYYIGNLFKKYKDDDKYISRIYMTYLKSRFGITNTVANMNICSDLMRVMRSNGMFDYIFEPLLNA